MSSLDNNMMDYWVIKLGNLYYCGGLTREKLNEETFSWEFAKDEEVAFPVLFEDVALRLAERCGGTAIKKRATLKEVEHLSDAHERYINSESRVIEESKQQFFGEYLKNANK